MTTLNFDVFWRDRGAAKGLRDLGNDAETGHKHVKTLSDYGPRLAGAFTGFAAIDVFHSWIQGARESNAIARITQNVIQQTGGAAHVTAAQVGDLATSISNKTGADDEAVQSGENMLLTFTNVRNEVGKGNDIFNQASQTVVDLAAAMNHGEVSTDGVKSASIQLGKALNDPIKGISALQRVGVSFTAQQKDQIKALVASGHTLDAQKIILGELNKEFGGTAKAAADPLQRLSVIVGNLGESMGNALLPALDDFANWFADTGAPAIQKFADVLQATPPQAYAVLAGLVAVTGAVKAGHVVLGVYRDVSTATGAAMRILGLRTAEAAAAEVTEAGAAGAAATSTAAAGDAAAVASGKFGMLGKVGLAGAVVGLGALATEATDWLGHAEVTSVKTGDLADAFLHLGNSAKAPQAAIDAVSTKAEGFYGTVQSGTDVMKQFGDLAQGAFSMSWDNIIGRADSGTERVERFNATAAQMDAALAQLVQSGHGAEASVMFEQLLKSTQLTGDELQHVRNRFGQYQAAAADAARQSDATTRAIGDENSVLLGVQHGGNTATVALRGVAAAQASATVKAREHGATLKVLLDEYPNYQKQVLAAAGATSTAKADTVQLTAAQVKHVRATLNAKLATDLLTKSLQANDNATLSLMGGEDGWFSALAAVSGAVKSNGRTLDVHTEKGRANRQVLEQLASAGLGYLGVIQKNNGVGPVFRRTLDQQWNKLYEAARRFGATRGEARKYADEILKVPKALATKVTTPGLTQARAAVRGLHQDINNLSNRRIKITVNSDGTFTQGTQKGAATGGAITGFSPTPTADNIPIAATAGEHMWSVGEVQGAGGHGQVERLRAMARAGALPRFAAGGSIGIRGSARVPSARALNAVIDADMMAAYKAASSSGGPVPGGSGVARWGPMVHRALSVVGLAQSLWDNWMRQIATESGGNPNAVQGNIGDVNNRSGDLAKGLLQVIGATYRGYHWPGTRWNVFDPWSNMTTAMNYGKHRYGSRLEGVIGHGHGYDSGGVARGPGWFPKGPAPERVLSPRQTIAFERLVPLLARGGVGGVTYEVHLHAPNYLGPERALFDTLDRAARTGKLTRVVRQALA